MNSLRMLPKLSILLGISMMLSCGTDDQEVKGGQTTASDGGGAGADGGTLADGAPAPGTDGASTNPGADGGGTTPLKDGGGTTPLTDGGTTTTKDGGGVTTKDGGGVTTKDGGGVVPGKDTSTAPPDTADDKNKKYQTCPELLTCAQVACQYDPKPKCEQICTDNSAWAAKQDFVPFADCLWGKCYPAKCKDTNKPDECIGQCYGICAGLLYTCMAEGQSGNKSCSTAWTCMEACNKPGQDEFKCNVECYKSMTKNSQKQFNEAFKCMSDKPGDNPMLGCMDDLLSCAADGAKGTEACIDIIKCTGKCDKGLENFPCSGKCYGKGTATAQKQFADVYSCFGAAEENKSDPTVCAEKMVACSNPSGTLNCLQIWPCIENCKKGGADDGVCSFECMNKAKKKEATAWVKLLLCSETHCNNVCKNEPEGDKKQACKKKCGKDDCSEQTKACLG